MDTQIKGLVFDIQGHSIHDGPGSRTTVFMKGCPLQCDWCCNPEGMHRYPEMMYYESRCTRCGSCLQACPYQAIQIDEQGQALHDRRKCAHCDTHECVQTCFHEAKCLTGIWYSVEDMMKIFQRDRHFWGSEGGVTLSGGEPLLQRKFAKALLQTCHGAYIHTCVETTCHVQPEFFLDVCQHIDWIFTDIKHMDPVVHQARTGVTNERILGNIRALAANKDWDGVLVVRTPIIPNFNDSEENIRATAAFIQSCGLDVLNLLPFHRWGESKYRQLDRHYVMSRTASPSEENMRRLQAIAQQQGIYCFTGFETPF